MKTLGLYALNVGAVAVLLAGCGALRPAQDDMQPPIAAPGRVAQPPNDASSSYQVLHRFGHTFGGGTKPWAPLLSVSGMLYGTTTETHPCHHHGCGDGTVFSVSTTGAKKVLYRFKGGVSDGAQPEGALIDVNGTFYGTTTEGGGTGCGFGCGTVYSLTAGGSEKVLYAFKGGSDGADPIAGLADLNGTLYGTTRYGGGKFPCSGISSMPGCGTVYTISPSGSEAVLYRFARLRDGWLPDSTLVDVKGTLYGTTAGGGVVCGTKSITFTEGCGTVYSITTGGSETVLHRFSVSLAKVIPVGGLLDVHGTLYGMTFSGYAGGSVYKISLTGALKFLYHFQGVPDGAQPIGTLIDANGLLYGTTDQGGIRCSTDGYGGCGTVFSLTTSGKETVLHSFTGRADGAYPHAGLAAVNDVLYGTTAGGGYSDCGGGCGTVFALSP
jgi:uncharacterized repeat protein (TIGR03803 family)